MDENTKKPDWTAVQRAIRSQDIVKSTDLYDDKRKDEMQVTKAAADPEGLVGMYRAKKIKRDVTLQMLKKWYDGELEVGLERIKHGTKIKKKELAAEADRFLAHLSQKHLGYLKELDLVNEAERFRLLERLGDQTSLMLNTIQSKEWPPEMIEDILGNVWRIYKDFSDKIMNEAMESPSAN